MSALAPRRVNAAGLEVVAHTRDGAGPTIVAVHGNSASHESFAPLAAHPALAGRALALVDLPGHGASPRAPSGAPGRYGMDRLAHVVAAAVDALGGVGPLVLGHSLGGHALLQALARDLCAGARGVVVWGTPPLAGVAAIAHAFSEGAALELALRGAIGPEDARRWAFDSFAPGPAPPWFVDTVLATDPDARLGLGASLADELRDEVRVCATSPVPIALLHPEADRVVRGDHVRAIGGAALWRQGAQVVAGGHYAHWHDAAAVVAPVLAFERELTGAAPASAPGSRP